MGLPNRFSVALALGISTVMTAHAAFAAGVDPAQATAVQREQAQALFLKGKQKYDARDYKGALENFRASIEIVQSPNTRLYVARALRELGSLVEAYAEFGRAAAEAKEHEHEDGRYGKAAEAANAERADLGKRLGFLRLAVTHTSDATVLSVGGSPILRAGWAEPVPVLPGSVVVELSTPGAPPVSKAMNVSAGQSVNLPLDGGIAGPGDAPPPPPPPVVEGPPSRPPWRPLWIAGYGVGVVGFVTFAIAGVSSNNTAADLAAKCGAKPCPAGYADEISRGKTEQTIANVGLVFGIIGALAGTTFLVLDLTSKPPAPAPGAAPTPQASLVFGPSYVGLHGTF